LEADAVEGVEYLGGFGAGAVVRVDVYPAPDAVRVEVLAASVTTLNVSSSFPAC
jgi:hypothetical protein